MSRIDVIAIGVGKGVGHAVLQLVVEQINIQARIADELLGEAVLSGVAKSECGGGKAIEFIATIGVNATRIERDIVSHINARTTTEAGVTVAIGLLSGSKRGNAIGGIVDAC